MNAYTVYKHTGPTGKVYICAVCKGRRKTTGGLRWSYKDEGQAAAIEALRLEVVNGVSS